MADTVSRLAIQVGMDTNGLKTGAAQGESILSSLASRFTLAVDPIQLAGQALSAVGNAARAAWSYLSDLNDTTEKVALSLQFAADSAADFAGLMSTTMDFGSGQFEDDEIANVVRQLKLFGAESQNIGGTLEVMGRLALGSGNSLEAISNVLRNIGQDGELTFKDLRQLMQMNIPITNELAKMLGVTKGEIVTMAEDGKISMEQVTEALAKMTVEGGRFGSAIELSADTVSGAYKELWDSIDELFRPLSALIGTVVREILKAMNALVISFGQMFGMFGEGEDDIKNAAGSAGEFVEEMTKGGRAAGQVAKETEKVNRSMKSAADIAKEMRAQQRQATEQTFSGFFKMQEEAGRLVDAMATPEEKFAKEQQRLRELLAAGVIDPQTFGRAMAKANEQLRDHAKAAREAANERERLNKIEAPQGLVRGTSGAATAFANNQFANSDNPQLQRIIELLQGGPVIRQAGIF